MLVIRLQRTGRKGHAMFRVIVQDSRRSPSSGKVVAYLGNYDPHNKKVQLDKEKVTAFLNNGAQPSDRFIAILKAESVKLPKWVSSRPAQSKAVRNPDKRRSTAPEKPAEPATEEPAQPTEAAEAVTEPETAASEQPVASEKSEDAPKSEPAEEPEAAKTEAEAETGTTKPEPEQAAEAEKS